MRFLAEGRYVLIKFLFLHTASIKGGRKQGEVGKKEKIGQEETKNDQEKQRGGEKVRKNGKEMRE